MEDSLFWLLAVPLVFFSALVVLTPNLVHAAISLVATFFMTAGLYILFQMEFVAIAQIMVYTGGLVIFVVITILLTTRLGEKHLPPTPKQRLWGLVISGGLLTLLLSLLPRLQAWLPATKRTAREVASLEQIGIRLLSPGADGFIIPFELISLLLLTALIGAVVIAKQDREQGDAP